MVYEEGSGVDGSAERPSSRKTCRLVVEEVFFSWASTELAVSRADAGMSASWATLMP
jgi:hypothetical protein